MSRRRRRLPMSAMDQINVTPLLDLTFLLLIAFMLTMPLMEYGTDVNAPELNGSELPQENFVSVTLTKEKVYMIDRQAVKRDELKQRLQALHRSNPKIQLLIRGDGACSYKEVMELLAVARNAGFKDATLVTQPESKQ